VKAPLLVLLLLGPARADKGVALGLFAEDPGWSYRPLLDEIKALGADHVELVVAWYQEDVAAVEVGDHPRYTAPESAVRRAVRDAHRAGLKVLLFPIVRLTTQHHAGEWRGTLRPRDRAAWFASYGGKLLALARLASEEHVEALSIGSELSTLDWEVPPWMALIAAVRGKFHGRLVYSGNWDHFRQVAIYPLVDELGLCGYFALGADLDGTWDGLRRELEAWSRTLGKPLLFTELGYLSQRGAAAWPWDEGATQPIDLEEQRRCYAAFCRTWSGSATLAGVYFWNWYGWGGTGSRGYTPRGKPAAEEIRRFFR
jgi:Glycoside Hydrolase Family 113